MRRTSPHPGRHAVFAVVLAVAAVAAWRLTRSLVAPDRQTATVMSLLGASGAASARPPDDRPGLPEPGEAAVARARAQLRAEPLSAPAYAVLALAAEKAGQDEQAGRLMAIAAAWGPRDLVVRTWLLARELRRGDARAAVAHLDAALHAHPEVLDDLSEALSRLLAEPSFRSALFERLAGHPPWRTRFIQVAVRQWREPEGLAALLDQLQATSPGLSAEELRPYLTRLVADGQVDEAYAAWLRGLAPEARARLTYLYNGDFSLPLTQMPFDWRMPAVPGVTAALGEAGGKPALSVGFLGRRVPSQPVLHELVLAPGDYRLSGRVRTDRLRAERGVRWRVACLTEPRGTLGVTEAFAGTAAWRDFTLDFTVPEEGCQAQALGLEADARTPSETQVSGVASFSGLDIVPLPDIPLPDGEGPSRSDSPVASTRCPPPSRTGHGATC